MVNAFDFKDTDKNTNDNVLSVDGVSKSSIKKKLFQTRKSTLFVANCRKSFCLYKFEVLESTRRSEQSNRDPLAICKVEHRNKESDKGKEIKKNIKWLSLVFRAYYNN